MIHDMNGVRILEARFEVASDDAETGSVLIECHAGMFLSGETVEGLTVEARAAGEPSWTDIETTPIDLSTWDGTMQEFEVRVTAPAVTSDVVELFALRVGV